MAISHQADPVQTVQADRVLAELISDLADKSVTVRRKARLALEEIGPPAADSLVRALNNPLDRVRWEAAKALSNIADPRSAPALIARLEDKSVSIRWLAAEGLIAVGLPSLRPLLMALIDHADSVELREGAHHVLHDLLPQQSFRWIAPLLQAFEGPAPALRVPLAARDLLHKVNNGAMSKG